MKLSRELIDRFELVLIKGIQLRYAHSTVSSWMRLDGDHSPESSINEVPANTETDQTPQGERLLNELVSELACRLTAISSLLGACQLSLPTELANLDPLQKVRSALQVAHETVDHANQVARSVKGLVRSCLGSNDEPLSLNSVLDQVLQIVGPKLQSAAARVRIEMQTSGAVVADSAAVILALVSLIDATLEELRASNVTHRQIKIYTATHGGNVEVFVAGLPFSAASPISVVNSPISKSMNPEPIRHPTPAPSVSVQMQRSALAQKISSEIHGNVVVTRNARNEPGYRMLITQCSRSIQKCSMANIHEGQRVQGDSRVPGHKRLSEKGLL